MQNKSAKTSTIFAEYCSRFVMIPIIMCIFAISKAKIDGLMPNKFRKAAKKKYVGKKKMQYFFYMRRSKSFSWARKMDFSSSTHPRSTTISTEGLTQKQIYLMKGLEEKGRIPKITWIITRPNGFDDKLKYALTYLHSIEAESMGCQIQKGYDYAWIKIAMDSKAMPERYDKYKYMSTPKFVEYIKSLGFTDIAGSKTINKALTNAKWLSESNEIVFDKIYIHISERKRRNRIALKFLEIMNEV